MAQALSSCGNNLDSWRSLGFYVLAPEKQIERGHFASALTTESILRGIRRRMLQYGSALVDDDDEWEERWVKPLVARMQIQTFAWETALEAIERNEKSFGEHLRRFYEMTLSFNRPTAIGEMAPGEPFSVVNIRS
jgi:hypothetical protein